MDLKGTQFDETSTPEQQLERGQVVYFPSCPFELPTGDDHAFLLQQELGNFRHKNISFDPQTGKTSGFVRQDEAQAERLRSILVSFAASVTKWVRAFLSHYAEGCKPDRVSYRPQEEATRRLRMNARNDLLHVDAFPNRPSRGDRILRVFANINPTEPRIWVTSDPFAKLLERYGTEAGLPGRHVTGWIETVSTTMLNLFRPGKPRRTAYDSFMLRFHDYLKKNEAFQERGAKRLWSFSPGSAWLALTDTCSHSVLRGRYALEHSYFISRDVLVLPDEAPEALLAKASAMQRSGRAA